MPHECPHSYGYTRWSNRVITGKMSLNHSVKQTKFRFEIYQFKADLPGSNSMAEAAQHAI